MPDVAPTTQNWLWSTLLPSYTLTSLQVIIKDLLSKSPSPTETPRLSFAIDYIDHTHGHTLLGAAVCACSQFHALWATFPRSSPIFFTELKGFFRDSFLRTLTNSRKRKLHVQKGTASHSDAHLQALTISLNFVPQLHREFKTKRYRGDKVIWYQ